jgi:hypothetical protein
MRCGLAPPPPRSVRHENVVDQWPITFNAF